MSLLKKLVPNKEVSLTKQKNSGHMFGNIANIVKVQPSQQTYMLLMDEINYDTVKPVMEWIIEANFAEEKPQAMTLLVCSLGGHLSAAWALIDVMKGSNIPISTVALGDVASAGTMIVMSGEKGQRFATHNTTIMSHQYTAGTIGKYHELVTAVKDFAITDNKMIEHYKKCTGMDEKKIRSVLLPPHDVFLTPEEAKKHGIIDHIKDLN